MGELSKKETEVLEFLVEIINSEIFSIEQQERDLGRLDYSLCSDDTEKRLITEKKVAKLKKNISKCNPTIAGYLSALTIDDPLNLEFDEKLESISKNFLLTEYYELFEFLINEDISNLQNYNFESIIESLGFKYKPLKDFVQGVCDINSFYLYKSFLDIPKNNNLTYTQAREKLNNAFFRLEAFMNGSVNQYIHFDFNTAFTQLFYLTKKVENFTYDNCKLIGQYWELTEQIRFDYDKTNFTNVKAYKNKAFCNDCNVITSISWDRLNEFNSFTTPDELEEITKKKSISDVIKSSEKSEHVKIAYNQLIVETPKEESNPYPRIFKDNTAYSLFERLVAEFGNTKENLSNYSFVFHKMTYAGFIHFDLLHKTYFDMLSKFDISIDRIKPKGDIGKVSLRESVYSKVKQTL